MVMIDEHYIAERFGVKPGSSPNARTTEGERKLPFVSTETNPGGIPGTQTDPNEVENDQLNLISDTNQALRKIVNLASFRERSTSETRKRLTEAGFAPPTIDEAIAKALDYRFLDDARFADSLIRGKLAAGKGLAGIERALKEHGIDPDSIPGYPDDYVNDESQLQAAIALLERRPPRAKDKTQSALGKLIRAGYSYPIAKQAVELWDMRDS